MEDRSLAPGVVGQPVRRRVEHAEKRGDEPVRRQVVGELVVDVPERVVEPGPRRTAMRSIARTCVTDSAGPMPCPVASPEQEHHRAVLRDDVEDVASGLIRRAAPARDLVAGSCGIVLGSTRVWMSRATSSSRSIRCFASRSSSRRMRWIATAQLAANARRHVDVVVAEDALCAC